MHRNGVLTQVRKGIVRRLAAVDTIAVPLGIARGSVKARAGRVPGLPVIAVQRRPTIDGMRFLKGERAPRAPVHLIVALFQIA